MLIESPVSELQLAILLPEVERIARKAGELIMQVYVRDFEVMIKEDKSPVTEADLLASAYIESELKKLAPEIPFLSEESAIAPFSVRSTWHSYWLVDPLDGTRSFVKKEGEFTVNIALIHQHNAVLGVVYDPITSINYYAAKDVGAFKRDPEGNVDNLVAKPLGELPVITGNRSRTGTMQRFLKKVGRHKLIEMSSSLKICLVAEGRADLYARFWPTSEWDTAAGHAIIDEAGGRLVDIEMQPLLYNMKDSLLNPHFFVMGNHQRDWSQDVSYRGEEKSNNGK
ncbi:MAG TPA: 3'(2'),5'-bisphosphate nucleotidase [Thiothrix sp.]|nr:3'(2'),5'-bisphosphate nucleotidase [Thiothrix sp.]